MSVFASLVVGGDGSTSVGGNSRQISSGVDRTTFLERRRSADFLLIGGETARCEPYHRTPVPVVISSRSMINALSDNRLAYWWNLSPVAALAKGINKFGGNVLVESGPKILDQLLLSRSLDGIYLSITRVTGGENRIDISDLLARFNDITSSEIEGTTFIEAEMPK